MPNMHNQVVVVTGASSGIGRATALTLARHGAHVVAVARRREALEELARESEVGEGHLLPLPGDVTDEEAVKSIARQTAETLGRIDAWVNNAAVTLFGRFDDTPADDFRRVIDTNLFGYVNGARAVLPWFREQGAGVLVNVASVVGHTGQPLTAAYVTSKYAIIGFSEALRQELIDTPGIEVVTVLPASTDTPLFQHGANYTGRKPQPMPPIYAPEAVARAILRGIRRPRREVVVGVATRGAVWASRAAPGLTGAYVARATPRRHFQAHYAEPGSGNLYSPSPGTGAVSGGWRSPGRRSHWKMAIAGLALVGLGAAAGSLRGGR